MFKTAAKIAAGSNHSVYKMGAVVVKGGRILSSASNRINRGCRYIPNKKWKNTLHAEQGAIVKLLKLGRLDSLAGADLYVTRINKVGHAMMSKPCEFCQQAASAVGIKRIFYINKEGNMEHITC